MLKIVSNTFATDAEGNEVFLQRGTIVTDIEDAGPVEDRSVHRLVDGIGLVVGWNVSFKVKHPGMPVEEIVTMDAVKLLKAL